MQHLKLLFLLVLTTWILLLSGMSELQSAPLDPPVAHDADAYGEKQNNKPDQAKDNATTITQEQSEITIKQGGSKIKNENGGTESTEGQQDRMWPPSAGWAIVYVTIFYTLISLGQLWAIYRQAKIANKTLRLTQRPKLRVREVSVVLTHLAERGEFTPEPVRVTFEIANVGGFPACIRTSHGEVILSDGGVPIRFSGESPRSNNVVGQHTLEPGKIRTVSFTCGKPVGIHRPAIWKRFYSSLYVMGYIDYRDELDLTRRTAFCRRFMRTEEGACFVLEENPNYEYED